MSKSNKNQRRGKKTAPTRSRGRSGRNFSGPLSNRVPFPERRTVTLNYAENNVVTVNAASLSSWYYYQSSLYDPRGNLGGHQPLYFDQLSAIYAYYRVDRMDYTATFDIIQGNSLNCVSGIAYVLGQKLPTFQTDIQTLEERPYLARTAISMYSGPKTIRGRITPHQLIGIPRRKYEDENDYSATVTANPGMMAYLVPYIYNASSAAYSCHVRIEIKYHCTFYQLFPVSSS